LTWKLLAALIVLPLALGAILIAVTVSTFAGGALGSSGSPGQCVPAPQPGVTLTAAGLDATQLSNAATIVQVGEGIPGAGVKAAIIAVATALVESTLNVLANPAVPASLALPHQGLGENFDSVGLFQQRGSQGWGTVPQMMGVTSSTQTFVSRLVALPAFHSLPPEGSSGWTQAWGAAAQDVQRSGVPGAYQGTMNLAAQLVGSAKSTGQPVLDNCTPTGTVTLPKGTKLPAAVVQQIDASPPQVVIAISFALAQVGDWYLWGAVGGVSAVACPAHATECPGPRFDCSGLVMMAYRQAGISLPRTSEEMVTVGAPETEATLTPGALVYPEGPADAPPHVQMYLGGGLIVEAPETGQRVHVVKLWGFVTARQIVPG
jgi:cell wall-associated NlpC family hydrolase